MLFRSVFVATLGFSNYTFAEATWSQQSACWIGSPIRAFEFFGGLPRVVVPDNTKTGVTKACRYEPDLISPDLMPSRIIFVKSPASATAESRDGISCRTLGYSLRDSISRRAPNWPIS